MCVRAFLYVCASYVPLNIDNIHNDDNDNNYDDDDRK